MIISKVFIGCSRLLLLLFIICFTQVVADEGVKVRFVKRVSTAFLKSEMTFQVYVTNQRPHSAVFVGHLNLPQGWKAVPANDILFHLMPNQTIVKTVIVKVPDYEQEGDFKIRYEVSSRNNPNDSDSDESLVIVKYTSFLMDQNFEAPLSEIEFKSIEPIKIEEIVKENSNVSLSITSDTNIVMEACETCFISCLIKNNSDHIIEDHLSIILPTGWQVVPHKQIKFKLLPQESTLEIFGIKIPESAFSEKYTLRAEIEKLKLKSMPVTVEIASKIKIKVEAENCSSYYLLNEPIDIDLAIFNEGNSLIDVRLEAIADPFCNLRYRQSNFSIEPQCKNICSLHIEPNLSISDTKQFILFKVIDNQTSELLFKDTLVLNFAEAISDDEESFSSIPAYFSIIALGDNSDQVMAVQIEGGGIINPDRDRYVDFIFRLPTKARNVIYGADQRLYFGMGEPGFELNLGDTVYSLSPLTQYRYGRGGGFDLTKGRFSLGAHYTENTFNNDYNPKESCGYVGYQPNEKLYIEGNYLNRNIACEPTSNIVSISSEYQMSERIYSEFEIGNDFVANENKHDSFACRASIRGQIYNDTWFDFEKIHAGSSFYGYYNDVDTLSGTIDYPINCRMRGNISITDLRQNFKSCSKYSKSYSSESYDDKNSYLKQRQYQYNANVSYDFLNGGSFSLNGLLLRAWDRGYGGQYNFFQQWCGFTTTFPVKNGMVTGIVSFGQQNDFCKHRTQSFLQRYWWSYTREIKNNFFAYIFYEGGNTNYYDARPWRTSFGGSLGYRYSALGFAEIFLQRVQNRVDLYELNQVSFRLSHTFSNRHRLDVSAQYFHYQKHYPNDLLFLVSYTIPLSIPIRKQYEKGHVYGYMEDVGRGLPVREAMVNMGGKQCVTDATGRFAFQNMKKGTHDVKVEVLPKQLITKEFSNQTVNVMGGKNTKIIIPVISHGTITGNVLLYSNYDPMQMVIKGPDKSLDNPFKIEPMAEIRVVIDRNNGEEIFTAITNEKGVFHFPKLRPGLWNVHISSENLPSYYYFVEDTLVFNLEPEEDKKLSFEVRAHLPKILPLE